MRTSRRKKLTRFLQRVFNDSAYRLDDLKRTAQSIENTGNAHADLKIAVMALKALPHIGVCKATKLVAKKMNLPLMPTYL